LPIPSLPLFAAAEQHARQNPEKIAVIDTTKQQSFKRERLLFRGVNDRDLLGILARMLLRCGEEG
jgi:hypothetical protein